MFDLFLDFLFPKRSLRGEEGTWVTADEERLLRSQPVRIEMPELRTRGITQLDLVIAAGSYESSPLLRRAVRLFKYRRVRSMVDVLGSLMAHAAGEMRDRNDIVLCPVPLHRLRQFERGFNQSMLLAEKISTLRGWNVSELLRRKRATGSQAKRKKAERIVAMHGQFRCVVDDVPACVVLIDDVVTTGSTLDACAKELKEHGARCVVALVAGAA